jgi:hypothetical protein
MENQETWTGRYALLPSGQLVVIDIVHGDGYASLRRVGGELSGRVAVCKMASLQILDERETHVNQKKAQDIFLK